MRALDCPENAANLLLIVPRLPLLVPLLVPLLCPLLFPLHNYLTAIHLHRATVCDAESACSKPCVADLQRCRVRLERQSPHDATGSLQQQATTGCRLEKHSKHMVEGVRHCSLQFHIILTECTYLMQREASIGCIMSSCAPMHTHALCTWCLSYEWRTRSAKKTTACGMQPISHG